MVTKLVLGDIAIDVVMKDIKNVHLSVHPPMGHVRIAVIFYSHKECLGRGRRGITLKMFFRAVIN